MRGRFRLKPPYRRVLSEEYSIGLWLLGFRQLLRFISCRVGLKTSRQCTGTSSAILLYSPERTFASVAVAKSKVVTCHVCGAVTPWCLPERPGLGFSFVCPSFHESTPVMADLLQPRCVLPQKTTAVAEWSPACFPTPPEMTDASLHNNVCNSLRGLLTLHKQHCIPLGVSSTSNLLKSLQEMPVLQGLSPAATIEDCLRIAIAAKPPPASAWLLWLKHNHTFAVSAANHEDVGAVLGSLWSFTRTSNSETPRRQALARKKGLLLFKVLLHGCESKSEHCDVLGYYAIHSVAPHQLLNEQLPKEEETFGSSMTDAVGISTPPQSGCRDYLGRSAGRAAPAPPPAEAEAAVVTQQMEMQGIFFYLHDDRPRHRHSPASIDRPQEERTDDDPSASAQLRLAGVFRDEYGDVLMQQMPGKSSFSVAMDIFDGNVRYGSLDPVADIREYLLKAGLRECEMSKGLFRAAQYCHEHGWVGVSPHSLVWGYLHYLMNPPARTSYLGDNLAAGVRHTIDLMTNKNGEIVQTDFALFEGAPQNSDKVQHIMATLEFSECPETFTRVYHGSNIGAIENILYDGPDSGCMKMDSDFGQAFYTTLNLGCAVEYMNLARQQFPMDGAILVLDVDLETLEKFDLHGDDATWSLIVRACRTNRIPNLSAEHKARLRNSDVIMGPIVANCHEIERVGNLSKAPAQADDPWTQIAFTAESGAARLQVSGNDTIVRRIAVLRFGR